MLTQVGKKFKAVSGKDAFEFEYKLNAALDLLNKKGIKYELTFNYQLGYCAYIVYEEKIEIPENAKDEYEQVGETHNCIECPYYVRPTDGRVRYTKCRRTNKLARGDDSCCEIFYEELSRGMLKVVEVDKWKKAEEL